MSDIVYNSFDVVFAWDNKVWRSLVSLVAFPGKLTREYLDGRIARYVHPSKLFWFLTIIFFALLVGVDIPPKIETETETVAVDQVEESDKDSNVGVFELGFGESAQYGPSLDQDEILETLYSWAPYLVLILVPFFALLVRIFFYNRNYYYADYLIFALHFHAFLFLLFSLWLLIKKVFPSFDHSLWFVFIIPMTYTVAGLHRVFGSRIVPTIFKILLLALSYFIVMIAVAVCFIVFYASIVKKIPIPL